MADAVHYDCLQGVQAAIQALTLTLPDASALPDAQVYLRKLPTDRAVPLPAVIVAVPPSPETLDTPGAVGADDWGYPCWVVLVVAANGDLTIDGDYELRWRQQIRDTFHNRRPSAVVSALSVPLKRCVVEPGPVIDVSLFQQANVWVSSLLVRVVTREVR